MLPFAFFFMTVMENENQLIGCRNDDAADFFMYNIFIKLFDFENIT